MNDAALHILSMMFVYVCLSTPLPHHLDSQDKHGCDICADVVFLFDDSSSIPVADPLGFSKMKQFMVAVIQSFTFFGPPSGVQVSVVLVAHTVRNHFYLKNFTVLSEIIHAVENFPELKGSATAIGEGLKFVKENSFLPQNGGGRPCAKKFVILLTDGKHNLGTMPKPQAEALKKNGVTIFSIGVGPNVLISELKAIASEPEFVFSVTDFTQLTTINGTIVDDACKVAFEDIPEERPYKDGPYMSGFIPYGYVLMPVFFPAPFMHSPWQPMYPGNNYKTSKQKYKYDWWPRYDHQLPGIFSDADSNGDNYKLKPSGWKRTKKNKLN